MPEPSLRRMSVRHRAYWLCRSRARASCRDEAVSHFRPIRPRVSTSNSRMSRSSSTIRALAWALRWGTLICGQDTALPPCVQVRRAATVRVIAMPCFVRLGRGEAESKGGASTPRLRRYAQHERADQHEWGSFLDQHEWGFLRIPDPSLPAHPSVRPERSE